MRRVLLVALFFAAAAGTAMGAAAQPVLSIAMSSEPTTVDPHFFNAAPNNNVAAHVFEALVRFDSDARLEPALAESWRLIDDLTWEFRLRRGVRFHDGTELTADDVIWSLERPAAIKGSPGPFTLYTRQIVAREAVDRYTVRVRTAAPYPLMLNDLSSVFIISRAASRNASAADFASGKAAVGTGPFRLVSFRSGERIELARNDAYWGPKPAWSNVTFRFIPSDPVRIAALRAGAVDAIEHVPSASIAELRKDTRFRTFAKVSHRVIYFTLDQSRDPSPFVTDKAGKPLAKNPLKDLRVRQALSRAIHRQAIADVVMEGLGVPTANLVPSPMFGHNPSLAVEPYDPEGARRLLAQAGYPDGFGLTLHGPNNRYVNDEQILQAVAQMLVRAGLQVRVEALPFATFFPRANARKEFSMALAGWGSQTGEVSSPLRSIVATINADKGMGTVNFGMYSNPKLDRMLEEGLRTVDDASREKLLRDAVAVAVSDVALIPIHHQVVTWATRAGLSYAARTDERTYAHQFGVK